jgi:hypothetical protein
MHVGLLLENGKLLNHDFGCGHEGKELPGDDVSGEVIQNRRQVIPTSSNNSEVSKIRLPQLIDSSCWIFK